MTTIDELVISLSLDARNFNAQQQQAVNSLRKFEQQATTTATNTERGAQKMVDGFSRVTKEVLGVGAAILGVNGLKDLAVNLTQVAGATERMAEAFEIDPEMLNKWQGFLQAVGNQDFGTTAASLGALSKAVQEFRLTQKGPLLEAIPWLGRLGVSPSDIMTGSVSQAVNSMLLKIGGNVNRPENAGVRTELLSHLPGMTPTMMRGLERAPTQSTLDKYLTATTAQMQSASRMMEEIAELALALRKRLNTLLPEAEGPVTGLVGAGKKIVAGDVSGGLKDANKILGQGAGQGRSDVEDALVSWLRSHNLIPPEGTYGPPKIAQKRTYFPDPGPIGVPPTPLDTSAMPRTQRFPDGRRSSGNVTTNHIQANISAPKSDNPQLWADIWADRVTAVMSQGGGH